MTDLREVHWFAERDIDVLLAEELRINMAFGRWFLSRLARDEKTEVGDDDHKTEIALDAAYNAARKLVGFWRQHRPELEVAHAGLLKDRRTS